MIDYGDLNTKGYCVVKSFISADLIKSYINFYTSTDKVHTNENYKITTTATDPRLHRLVQQELKKVSNHYTHSISLVDRTAVFFDSDFVNLQWHQDHEIYYLFHEAHRYLNFWIPLSKPSSTESGLSLIPLNLLPISIKDRIIGTGGKNLRQLTENSVEILFCDTDEVVVEEMNLSSIVDTPEIGAGDCIIFRGDVFHRSQENSHSRLAISVWAFDPTINITAENYFQPGKYRNEMIEKSKRRTFNYFNNTLKIKNSIPITDII